MMATATQVRENPLVEGLERRPVPHTTLTIAGATGTRPGDDGWRVRPRR